METIAISEFKTHALEIIARIATSKENIVITKRGKPLVQVMPFKQNKIKHKPGKLSKTLVFEKDIITPIGDEIWEACK
jgi:prevent-host-death family protein